MKNLFFYLYSADCGRFALALLFTILSNIFEVMLAYLMMSCVDFAMNGSLSQGAAFSVWLILYMVFYLVIDYFTKRLKWSVVKSAQESLRNDVVQNIMSMPVNQFRKNNTGYWLTMLTEQCDIIEESFFKIWFGVFSDTISFVFSAVLLGFISWKLALFVFISATLQMLIPKIMGPMIAKKKKLQLESAQNFTVTAAEHLNGFDLLKSFNLTAQSLRSISEANHRWEESKFASRLFTSIAQILSFAFGQLIYLGIFFFGALLILSGEMTVSMMIMASQLVVYIASPLQTLSDDITEIRSAREVVDLLRESFSDTGKTSLIKNAALPKYFKKITFNRVSFDYDGTSVFEEANCDLLRGGKYLLCGPSGSGKTTFIKLLTGAEMPSRGCVSIDGTNISNISSEQLARFILPCTQTTFIFNASLRDNISLFDRNFSDEEILSVLHKLEFNYLLNRYDDGLDHMIGQGGLTLSGGERQKIALARMELFNPPVVVFDESFANMDAESASRLTKSIISNEDKTVILVSHQISDELAALFEKKINVGNLKVSVTGD